MRIVICNDCSSSFTPLEQKQKCKCGKTIAIMVDGVVYHTANSTAFNIPKSSLPKYIDMQAVASKVAKVKKELNDEDRLFCTSVIEYLNKLAGTDYSTRFPSSHSDLILARRDEHNLSLNNMYHVIDKKAAQWIGTNYEIYLRPATLFNRTKFANYLGENAKQSGQNKAGIDTLRSSASQAKRNILDSGQ